MVAAGGEANRKEKSKMKKRIWVKVAGIENEDLAEIKKVKNAVETIKDFARHAKNLTENALSVDEKAVLPGEENAENNLCLSMVVNIEGLEDIMGNITVLTEKLKTEIEKMDEAIIIGIGKEPVKR